MQWGKGVEDKKRKDFPTCRKGNEGIRGVAPLILNLGASWRSEVYVTLRPLCHRERNPLTIGIEAGWAPAPVWTRLGRARHKIHIYTHTHTQTHTHACTHEQLRARTCVLLVQSTFTFSLTEQYAASDITCGL